MPDPGHRLAVLVFDDPLEPLSPPAATRGPAGATPESGRVAIADAPVPMCLQTIDHRIVSANKAMIELIGYDEAEIIGRDPIEFHTAESHSEVLWQRRTLKHLYERPDARATLMREFRHKDGRRIPYQLEVGRTVGPDGGPLWYSVMIDLSRLHQAWSQLRKQTDWINRVFEQAPMGMVVRDQTGRVLRSNARMRQILGEASDDEIAKALSGPQAHVAGQGAAGTAGDRVALPTSQGIRWLDQRVVKLSASGDEPESTQTLTVVCDRTREHELTAELQAALLRQSALLRSVSTGLAHVIGETIVLANPAMLRLAGRGEHELIGRTVESLFDDPADRAALREALTGSLKGQPLRRTVERRTASGQRIRSELHLQQVEPGRPELGALITLSDLTELLNQSDLLRETLADLEQFIDAEPVGVVHVRGGRITRSNRMMQRLLMRAPTELQGMDFARFCSDAACFDMAIRRTFSVGPAADLPVEGEATDRVLRCELIAADGARVDCLLLLTPIGEPAEQALMVVAVNLSRHQAMASLAMRMQERFDVFSSFANEAVLVVDLPSHQIVFANQAVDAVLGTDAASLIGQEADRLLGVVRESDVPTIRGAFNGLLSGRHADAMIGIDHPRRGPLSMRVRMYTGSSESTGYVFVEDITDSLLLEQKRLAEAVAQRDVLVREVHHRIKNSLQGVAGLLQQMGLRHPQVNDILVDASRQIQAIARIHGLQVKVGQLIDVPRFVESIASGLSGDPASPDLLIECVTDGQANWAVPETEAVPFALILNELIGNALRFRSEPAPVRLRLQVRHASILLRITNIGSLAPGFSIEAVPVAASGLGLVKAMLPRRGARLTLGSSAGAVEATLELGTSALRRDPSSESGSARVATAVVPMKKPNRAARPSWSVTTTDWCCSASRQHCARPVTRYSKPTMATTPFCWPASIGPIWP
ncbi:MAG: PAS domain S-box protein [Burkholderiaceae bacterium]